MTTLVVAQVVLGVMNLFMLAPLTLQMAHLLAPTCCGLRWSGAGWTSTHNQQLATQDSRLRNRRAEARRLQLSTPGLPDGRQTEDGCALDLDAGLLSYVTPTYVTPHWLP